MLITTELAYRVSELAETGAHLLGWRQLIPEHILLALLVEDGNNLIRKVLEDAGVTHEEVRKAVLAVLSQGDSPLHDSSEPIMISNSGIVVVELADYERAQLGHRFASNGHFLLGVLSAATTATTILNNFGIYYATTREYLRPLLDDIDEAEAQKSSPEPC